MTAPAAGASVSNTVTLTATATDPSGIQAVDFYVGTTKVGSGTASGSNYSYSWNSTTIGNGSHNITANATDKAGNSGTSAVRTVTVANTLPCTGNPSQPTNLRATSTSFNSIALAWDGSTAAAGCVLAGYDIYRDGVKVNSVASGTTYTDTNLAINQAYSYFVVAKDSTGHNSPVSPTLNSRTSSDSIAPSAPTNLAAPMTTANSISLTWSASTDNVATTGYYIYRNGAQVGVSNTASYTDTGLQPNTTFNYTVKAFDASGNQSAASAAGSFKTLQGTGSNYGDLDGNGSVALADLSIMLRNWNATGVPVTQGDVNADGKVNLSDLSILLKNWGKNV
jgi:chitodextrinase